MDQKSRKVLDIIANVGMAVFGISAIILVSFKSPWGFVAGLLSQPFFFTCSIMNRQWGLFHFLITTIFETLVYIFVD